MGVLEGANDDFKVFWGRFLDGFWGDFRVIFEVVLVRFLKWFLGKLEGFWGNFRGFGGCQS